ncbi:MAG TPA: hypothetical protein GXZ43_03900 [Clostridiaceae bacterium]|nr:hypothetical protein [Clostridiaceae bacterium]
MKKRINKNLIKIFSLFLIALLTLSIVGCGKKDAKKDGAEGKKEDGVLLDQDGIKITFLKYEKEALFGPEYHFKVENSTDKKLRVHMEHVKFDNGKEDTFPIFTTELEPKGFEENYYSLGFALEEEDYDKVKSMEIVFSLLEDDYTTIKEFDPVTVSIPNK